MDTKMVNKSVVRLSKRIALVCILAYLLQPISPTFIWLFWLTLVLLFWLGLIWLGSALELLIGEDK
ncbi:MAG: hypothetical protein KDJ65_14270 [Anaerolineae bacterium]|nr:hypothetical protein [Anaerolineae bacterium]